LLRWPIFAEVPSTLRSAASNASRIKRGSSTFAWLPMRSWLTTMGARRGTPISILI
jgi:hypothetical protein